MNGFLRTRMRDYQSRAWRLVEALETCPFKIEDRIDLVQRFLDEERKEAREPMNAVIRNVMEGF